MAFKQIAIPARLVLQKTKRAALRRAGIGGEPHTGEESAGSPTLSADAPAPSGSNEKWPDDSVSNARPEVRRRLGGQTELKIVTDTGLGSMRRRNRGSPSSELPSPVLVMIEGGAHELMSP